MTNIKQKEKTFQERQMEVYKRNDLIQQARYSLSVEEQRIILYCISKIKPDDTYLNEYKFSISDFYALCGLTDKNYTHLKHKLKGLSDKSWWAEIDDQGTESLLRWFTTLRTNKGNGQVTVKFHEDMFPFLLDLQRQAIAQGMFYTHYQLQYILPMKSKYSIRLYELLKSYQLNNKRWYFDIDDIKRRLECSHYQNFKDFRKYVLEISMREINEFSDINVEYETEKEGYRIRYITFYMKKKTRDELLETKRDIRDELDGQLDFEQIIADFEQKN